MMAKDFVIGMFNQQMFFGIINVFVGGRFFKKAALDANKQKKDEDDKKQMTDQSETDEFTDKSQIID